MKHYSKFFLAASTYVASLLCLMAQDDPLKAPDNVAKAPEEAVVTESGLASVVLKAGEGTEKPSARDTVTVHYTGWQSSDGEMFDSSVKRGEPTSFPLNQVIKGWTEGLQLMVTGEKRRFWIPEGLAYGPAQEGSSRPGGQLVFDVELISIEKAAPPLEIPEGAKKTESNFDVVVIKPGEGEKTKINSIVKFHYSLIGAEDKVIQSSKQQADEAPSVGMAKLPPFFAEGLLEIAAGGEVDVYVAGRDIGVPEEMAKFKLELEELKEPADAPAVPEDVAAVPEDATKTESGLEYKVLKEGEVGDKPTKSSSVTVHYTGWETNGEMFDSSVTRGETTSFPLGGVIAGWTEGLQLMSKGDKYRFWIPEDLAYGPKQGPNRPGGLLVFDVELVDFK